jgi:hypothetical protein
MSLFLNGLESIGMNYPVVVCLFFAAGGAASPGVPQEPTGLSRPKGRVGKVVEPAYG